MMAKSKVTIAFDDKFNFQIDADVSGADLTELINVVWCAADLVSTVTHMPFEQVIAYTCSLNGHKKKQGYEKKTVIVMPHLDKDKPHD